ncbi:MAG: penicillin-binding protein activator [candidate division Zixibacteria bacterium]|nr:penicillin-binding protein activator [candidate division Zixibacteria bacterium]
MRKIILIFLVIVSVAYSQIQPESPYEGLKQALYTYSLGRYNESYKQFKDLAEFYILDGHHTIFTFMAAKSLYKNREYEKARREFQRFINEYPSSSYIGAAYLYLGHIAYRENNLLSSAIKYLKANDINHKSKAGIIAANNLKPMLEKELSISDIESLVDNYPQAELADEIVFYLGKRHCDEARYKRAVRVFKKYIDNYPKGSYIDKVNKLYTEAVDKANAKITVGVLAPLTGSYADYGLNLVEGVKLVFDNALSIGNKKIELMVIDTYGSPVYATKAVKTLIQEEPVAIIGPLRSESAVGAAIVAGYSGIPLITPTASEKGITELGNNIYQISPSAEIIAAALAEYAMKDLGIKNFGIIAPGDFTGRQVSKAFSQKVYQLGGEVLSNTFYEIGQTDYSNQIKPLREILLMKTEEQLAMEEIDSTEYYDLDKEEWLEQDDWRVYLGGLFLPGYAEELSLLVPQIRYHVISTKYFGLDGWDSKALMNKIDRYIEGAVFATDYHPGSEGSAWDKFYIMYYQKYNREPGRVSALAYDAANLIKLAIQGGAYTPEGVNDFLSSLKNYNGASCIINFKSSNNANNAVSIYQIMDEDIVQIK